MPGTLAAPIIPLVQSFERLFFLLVLDARDILHRRMGLSRSALLPPGTLRGWEQYLLNRLIDAGGRSAHWQFQVFKTVRTAFPSQHVVSCPGQDIFYEEFVQENPRGRLEQIFREFPALESLCRVLCANWVEAAGEFFARLEADQEALDRIFAADQPLGPATKTEAGLSDPHGGGRSVVRVTFESGTSLIYKPRSVAPEAHFRSLTAHINANSVPYRLKAARCWDRGAYGWMEDVPAAPCSTPSEVRGFYWRMGALLGLVHLARGVDFHRENLVAAGEYPILIDLETLWHPQESFNPQNGAASSVLRTGFLPINNPRTENTYRWSALALAAEAEVEGEQWPRSNEDDKLWQRSRRDCAAGHYLVTLNGVFQPASKFVNEVVAGFRWLGDFLLGKEVEKASFTSWLNILTLCPRRLVLRSTSKYQPPLKQLTSPHHLRDKQVSLESLPAWSEGDWPELPEERQALEQLDVPRLAQKAADDAKTNVIPFGTWSVEDYLDQIPIIVNSLTQAEVSP